MDRRKRTGVALAAGLLFLFVTEILLLFLAGNSLYKEEQGKLGALVLSHPEQETEYIELFDRGKQRNRQEEEAGKELEERYGYTPFDGRSVKTFAAYGIGMAMVFVAGLGVSWVLFLRNKRDRQQDENNQEELREKYIELQNHFEKVREKLSREENNTKSLITDISHQLKTPIASLKMSCELAGSADLTWEEREEFYKKEWDEIQRLENLLDSLIHVSRLESGMIQIQPEMGSLKNTLVQAVNSVYMKAYEKEARPFWTKNILGDKVGDYSYIKEVLRKYFRQRSKVFAGAYRNPNSGNRACYLHDAGIYRPGNRYSGRRGASGISAFLQRKPRVCKKTGGLWGWTLSCQKNFGGAERHDLCKSST